MTASSTSDAPTGHVVIRRDTDGIAHVTAADRAGALFGQGFAAAADRWFQMDSDRRRATGRWSEAVGPTGVAADAFYVRAGLADAARADLDALRPETREMLDAYAAGVNAWLARAQPDDLPPEHHLLGLAEPEPWEPWHSLVVFTFRHLLMGTAQTKIWRSALLRSLGPDRARLLWPDLPPDAGTDEAAALGVDLGPALAALAAVGAEEAASNSFVIGPGRTATGAPILAGDPHRSFDVPNVYWQNHLRGGDLDVIGLSFPGVPGFPHFGHNAEVAWCITHGMADDQDVFVEQLRRSGAEVEGRTADGWHRAPSSRAPIAVADGEPVEIEIITTANGPIIAGDGDAGWGLSLRWTGTDGPNRTFDALLPMMTADSVAALDEAMRPWVVPVNNVLMADRAGSIGFRLRGRLARRAPAAGWTVVPGWTGAHDWVGAVDYDDQPLVVDPPDAYLVTANAEVVDTGEVYVTRDYAHPCRAERIAELLRAREAWDAESSVGVLADTHSEVAAVFTAGFVGVRAVSPLEAAAQRLLAGWDLDMGVESAAAAVYGVCRLELWALVAGALGLHDDRLAGGIVDFAPADAARYVNARLVRLAESGDDALLAGLGGWSGAYRAALRAGVRRLEVELGNDPSRWSWGALHRTAPFHPLGRVRPDLADRLVVPSPVPIGGDNDTVCNAGIDPPSPRAARGSVARYVFDLSDWDRSRWIVPHGVCGDPRSAHFTDQLGRWAACDLAPMRWSEAAIEAATESRLVLDTPS